MYFKNNICHSLNLKKKICVILMINQVENHWAKDGSALENFINAIYHINRKKSYDHLNRRSR